MLYYPHFMNEKLRLRVMRNFPRVIVNGRAGTQTLGISDFRATKIPSVLLLV